MPMWWVEGRTGWQLAEVGGGEVEAETKPLAFFSLQAVVPTSSPSSSTLEGRKGERLAKKN
jgi:hypothetical protein